MEIRPHRKIARKKTRKIMVGKVPVGGDSPISVQSMTNTPTADIKATVKQIKELEDAGSELVRITVNDFEAKIKQEVNYNRFRGNVIFSGIKAWEEFNWLGKIISIGDVKFEIFRKTKRCAATNVNPKTGLRDLNIPNQLQKIYGHYDLGVYGKVLNKGIIKINDEIKF